MGGQLSEPLCHRLDRKIYEKNIQESNKASTFKHLSGLKINFHKSELFSFDAAKDNQKDYAQVFGCNVGSFPFRYLGIPMHHRKVMNLGLETCWGKISKDTQLLED